MRPALRCLVVIAVLSASACSALGAPLRGVALVIGESKYENLPALDNPKRDARSMDDMLDALGFSVDRVLDGDHEKLGAALADFVEEAKSADVALVYYSGHGAEIGGSDYLVPVDTSLASPATAGAGLVPVAALLDQLAAAVPVTIVLLDACRTDAFPPGTLIQLPGTNAAEAPGTAGLEALRGPTPVAKAEIAADSLGMVIGFAASPGQPALDGAPGENSPYAAALLKHFSAGGYTLGDLMTLVTEEVYLKTRARQLPWVNSSLRRVLTFGAPIETLTGDDAAIRDGRRQLLLTIATEPPERRAYVESVARSEDVPLDALYGMLKVLGVDPTTDLDQQLKAGAARLKSFLAEAPGAAKSDPELQRLSGLADAAETEGVIDLALKYREEASARAETLSAAVDVNEANLKADRLQLGVTFAEHARTAALNFDHAIAADMWGKAFAQVEKWDSSLALDYLWKQAAAQLSAGQGQGDAATIEAAIATYDEAAKRAKGTDDLPKILSDQAVALQGLGDLTGDIATLDRSIKVFRDTLKHFPRDAAPLDWGRAQSNLGNSYNLRGDLSGDLADYRKGAAAQRAALEELTRDAVPFDWAIAEGNLGISLARLGEADKDGSETLEAAVSAFTAALEELSPDRLSYDWARTEDNLGGALGSLGMQQDDNGMLQSAIAAFEKALTVRTRARAPQDFAQSSRNLGIVARNLGSRTGDLAWFDRAIGAYRDALDVFDPDRTPLDWGQTQGALGIAAFARAKISGDRADLEAARDAFSAANDTLGRRDRGYADYFVGKIAEIDQMLGK